MSLNRLFAVLVVPLATACGGGDSGPVIVDTPPPIPDTPPPAAPCPDNIGTGSVGTDADPAGPECGAPGSGVMCDWYTVPMMGPNTGVKQFGFNVGLPGGSENDLLIIQYLDNPFVQGTARPFLTDATSTAAYGAAAFVFGNVNADGSAFDYFLFAGSGTINMTQVGGAAEAVGGISKGSITTTAFREVDDVGADVAGGCAMQVMGLSFVLEQGSATFQKPEGETVENTRYQNLLKAAHQRIGNRIQLD